MSINLSNLSIYALRTALNALYGQVIDNLSEATRSKWEAGAEKPAPVDNIVHMMEAGYTHLKEFPDDAERVAPVVGQAAYFISDNQLHNKTVRGLEIYNACRRALGEDAPGEDPAVEP